jgi:Protein of unknown function (DUF3551)
MTRSILLAGAALLSVSTSPLNAVASEAPWCAVIAVGEDAVYWDCRFRSFAECQPTVLAGNRGFCNPSPYYAANLTEPRNSAKRRARPQ